MKKIIVTIMVFLLSATVISYAGIFGNQTTSNDEYSSQSGALYDNSTKYSREDSGFGALFSGPSDDPGDRPDNGDGIGQEAPISDGVRTLAICCFIYSIIKVCSNTRKNKL
jgi:hypothetical protein